MKTEELKNLVQNIISKACELKDKHTTEQSATVNYAAIFAQSEGEYEALLEATHQLGKIVRETSTGPLFQIEPLDTVSGKLQVLKVRTPDETRPERGDADFTVADYPSFKASHLQNTGFKLIERPEMEMIELMDPSFNVRAYFSNPPMDQQLGLT